MMIKPTVTTYELAQNIALLKLKQDPEQRWKYIAVKEDLAAKREDSHILDEFIKTVIDMAEQMEAGVSPNTFMTPEMKKSIIDEATKEVEIANPS
jgi:hypothetical protein